MYKSTSDGQISLFPEFILPFGGHLDPENRFKLMARPLGNANFHKGGFWDYPDSTEQENK